VTNEAKLIKVPDATHPITIEADTTRVVARVGDTVIADTREAITLHEHGYASVYYIAARRRRPWQAAAQL
jgi:uncharacterized protein (DUF427 family)